ncbi:MAG TPA: hypothetical protein VGH19_15060 [Verrucomicrobiae bacterium]
MNIMQQNLDTADDENKTATAEVEEHHSSYLEDKELRIKSYVLVALAGAGLLFWCGLVFWVVTVVMKKWGT